MDELHEKYTALKLIVEELITEDIIHKIRTGHLDAGIISTPVRVANLYLQPLYTGHFIPGNV